ncbi:MAG: hypothetical protein AB8G96_16645 [Phycisphaerales bacterium]
MKTRHILLAAVAATLATPASPVSAVPGESEMTIASQEARDELEELEELGSTLKAAVVSGAMSEEDATKLYFIMAERLARGKQEGIQGADAGAADGQPSKREITLSPPSPRQIRMLFQPEFLRRDISILRNVLNLDRDQTTIADVLIDDYRQALDIAATPLREALTRYQRSTTDQWIVSVFDRIDIAQADEAVANMERALEAWNEANAKDEVPSDSTPDVQSAQARLKADAFSRRMIEATRTMDERIAALRQRVEAERADRQQTEVTAQDLVRLATVLRAERAALRTVLLESIEAITTDRQRGASNAMLDRTIARIQVSHLLPRGRLSGETMNLWAALSEAEAEAEAGGKADPVATGGPPSTSPAKQLEDGLPTIATLLDQRATATIDREIAGLAFNAAHDRLLREGGGATVDKDAGSMKAATRPFAAAVRREFDMSVAVRDALLDSLRTSASVEPEPVTVAEPEAEAAAISEFIRQYRNAALRRGFPTEMQARWSERAVATAAAIAGLDAAARDALSDLKIELNSTLRQLRVEAVALRVQHETDVARAQTEAEFGDREGQGDGKENAKGDAFGLERWFGMRFNEFAAVDDQVERRLRDILTDQQFESLPMRRDTRKAGAGKPVGKARSGAGDQKQPGVRRRGQKPIGPKGNSGGT